MQFSDPIVAGSTLIRPAIKSPDYVAGVSGWSINRDGSAEFNDVLVRGDITVTIPPYGDVSLETFFRCKAMETPFFVPTETLQTTTTTPTQLDTLQYSYGGDPALDNEIVFDVDITLDVIANGTAAGSCVGRVYLNGVAYVDPDYGFESVCIAQANVTTIRLQPSQHYVVHGDLNAADTHTIEVFVEHTGAVSYNARANHCTLRVVPHVLFNTP